MIIFLHYDCVCVCCVYMTGTVRWRIMTVTVPLSQLAMGHVYVS